MGKGLQGLTDVRLRGALAVGKHHDGKGTGLYLIVREGGGRAWGQRIRLPGGKVREIGHGTYPEVSLGEARRRAEAAQEQSRAGIDPVAVKQAAKAEVAVAMDRTLRAALDGYIAAHGPAWRSPKTARIFRNSLEKHAARLLDRPVAEIDMDAVLSVLNPIWTTTPVLAQDIRARLEAVLEWATAARWRSGPNPAIWKGGLRPLLAKPSTLATVRHHPALPYVRVPAFITLLRQQDSAAAKCLLLTILTAVRSGEARGAVAEEFDLDAATWTIPAARMKRGKPHVVPLGAAALSLLKGMLPASGLLFPSPMKTGAALSDMAPLAVVKRMHEAAIECDEPGWTDEHGARVTPHGFRSSFRMWAAEQGHPRDLAEHCLAHAVGSQVEQAYQRSTLLAQRRVVMAAWDAFCAKPSLRVVEPAGVVS